jgi:hypothetical protein
MISDLDVHLRFIVCRVTAAKPGEAQYEVRQLWPSETWMNHVDKLDGHTVTVIQRNDEVVDTAGECCGEFSDRGEARIQASRLQKLLEVMES